MGHINSHHKMSPADADESCTSKLSCNSDNVAAADSCDLNQSSDSDPLSPPSSPSGPLVDPRSPSDGISRTPIQLDSPGPALGFGATPIMSAAHTMNVSAESPFDHLDLEPIDGVHLEHETSPLPNYSLNSTNITLDSSVSSDSALVSSSGAAGVELEGNSPRSGSNPLAIIRRSFRRLQQRNHTPQQILRRKHKAKYTEVAQNDSIVSASSTATNEEPDSMDEDKKENQLPLLLLTTSKECDLVETPAAGDDEPSTMSGSAVVSCS